MTSTNGRHSPNPELPPPQTARPAGNIRLTAATQAGKKGQEVNTWIGQNHEQSLDAGRTLDDVRHEFPSWACWERNGLCYARRPHTPHHDYDAHGDDPSDLREAILLALSRDGR